MIELAGFMNNPIYSKYTVPNLNLSLIIISGTCEF